MNEWEREILRLSERVRFLESSKIPPIETRTIDNSIKIGENRSKIDGMDMQETSIIDSVANGWAKVVKSAKDNPVAAVFIGLVLGFTLFVIIFLFKPEGLVDLVRVLAGKDH